MNPDLGRAAVLAPPFHQISLPASRVPSRKLQAVRFCDPDVVGLPHHDPVQARRGLPPIVGPKFWSACALLHARSGLVPSTITVLRFMPRR